MKAEIHIDGLAESRQVDTYARRRLSPIVGQPACDLESLCVSLNRVTEGGSEGVRCQILARVSPRFSLSVEMSEPSARAAIDAAADRLRWALGMLQQRP